MRLLHISTIAFSLGRLTLSELVSDKRVEQAMTYLAETDEDAAKAKAKAKSLEQFGKTVKAFGFLDSQGTVAEREAKSLTTEEYKKYLRAYEEAVMESEKYSNKRASEAGIREVWRSLQANRRQGT
jgi:predicted transcriptional regulator